MDELYLQLPSSIREKLPKIQVDTKKHNEDAKVVGNRLYEKVKLMKENTFREKVAKYIEYSKAFGYDEDMKNTIRSEQERLIKKIEKTMDYRIVGGNDELLNSKIAENYRSYIERNPFIKTKENPEAILEITAKLVEYTPNKVTEKKYTNDFDEIYTDENGKEATNTVKYLGKHFFKTSNMKVEVKYKFYKVAKLLTMKNIHIGIHILLYRELLKIEVNFIKMVEKRLYLIKRDFLERWL